ncbi:MAG: hypothetical protein IPF79_04955 [Ignavibacteria bacterium]|nr:hypothetical protein [Ignavibacteria bacterium]
MAPDLVRKFHDKLNVALRFRLKGYFDGRIDTEYYEPTMSDPLELSIYDHLAEAELVEMIFFAADSKQIVLTVACR